MNAHDNDAEEPAGEEPLEEPAEEEPALAFMKPGQFTGPKIPGCNVDKVNIAAGLAQAIRFGYDSPQDIMVLTYALQRHARGEEDGAQKTALAEETDLTSWYAILAAALSPGHYDRCLVNLIHPDQSEDQCLRHKEHLLDDSDHVDEHGHHAPVLVHQSTLREVKRVQEAREREEEKHEMAILNDEEDAHPAYPRESSPAPDHAHRAGELAGYLRGVQARARSLAQLAREGSLGSLTIVQMLEEIADDIEGELARQEGD